MLPPPIPINRPVMERISWAEFCFEEGGTSFLKDEKIAVLLSDFKLAANASRKQMNNSGVVALCRQCDQEEGGSCCGRGLEDRYDAWLLLINRLLGVSLPVKRQQADGCLFLGKKGCLLKARHVICINYVCKKITSSVQPSILNGLREVEGREIEALFELNEQVKGAFRKWMVQPKTA